MGAVSGCRAFEVFGSEEELRQSAFCGCCLRDSGFGPSLVWAKHPTLCLGS
jgi:hypothetical protein